MQSGPNARAMQTSIFLAQLIGPVLLVIGIGMLANRAGYRAMAEEFLKSRALIYLAGLLALVPGLAIVLVHNVWVLGWPVIITILGWLSVVGGVFRLLSPQPVTELGSAMLAREGVMIGAGVAFLVLGAVLSLFGYIV
jgi:hypothetical protein